MKKTPKKNIFIVILIVILIDLTIGIFLFKSRYFSHLAIWNIVESVKEVDFYWQPEYAPSYFHFEPDSDDLSIFRDEISPLVKNKKDEFGITVDVARYVIDISSGSTGPALILKWDSPEGMLEQIKNGAGPNCFHQSILFSTFLSSLGIKSRLWTLENEKFNGIAHTVSEVYVDSLKKWVFVDVIFGFYVTDNGNLLSFIELRERLLDGYGKEISVHDISGEIGREGQFPDFYSNLIRCVFLRADNDFVNKYNSRYGPLTIFKGHIDLLPDDIRRGLDYLLGRKDIFIHYVNGFSRSLKREIIIAKTFFYFFAVSLVSLAIFLSANLSKRVTRHK